MKRKNLFIIKMGSTFLSIKKNYGDFEDWIIKGLGKVSNNVKVINVVKGESLPKLSECAGVIITGSHSMVTDNKEWSINVEKWIPELLDKDIPVLGICYGHQLIAKSLGGYVGYNCDGERIGTIKIRLTENAKDDILFAQLPARFFVNISHSQSVFSLPANSLLLALDSNDSIYAYRFGKYIWGIQFHPEFDKDIMMQYLIKKIKYSKKIDKVFKIDSILKNIRNTPVSNKILKSFFQIIKNNF